MSTSGREEPYELVVPGPVSRAIREELPEAVAWAVIEFVNGPLVDNPHRVDAELRGHLRGIHSAHLATFRIQYVIDDEKRTVTLRRVNGAGGPRREGNGDHLAAFAGGDQGAVASFQTKVLDAGTGGLGYS